MNDRTFQALDLAELTSLLAGRAQSPLGRQRVLQLRPSQELTAIEQNQELTSEFVSFAATGGSLGLGGISEPDEALGRLQVEGTALEPLQILLLEGLIGSAIKVRAVFNAAEARVRYPRLASLSAGIPDLRKPLASIHGKILPGGEIDDDATPEIRRLRHDIHLARTRIQRSLESILRRQTDAVQEEIITVRGGRFVVPIRTDSRGQVPGVLHGLSSSGQTTYVEPLSVIEQNNDLLRLRELEEIEIARLLHELTDILRANLPGIRAAVDTLSELDLTQAKARFALEFHCVRPELNPDSRLRLDQARHILLELNLRQYDREIVPISFELDPEHQVMIISGPNAGGKTVVLKTTGLLVLMAQMGLHVPARSASLPVFRQVFADIGDQQSLSANLSTFTAHMRNVAEMAGSLAPSSLLLIDELGTGTDPDEGAALAIAIVEHFRRAGATTIATTHYNALKMWAAQAEHVVNASVAFNTETLEPAYRLLEGVAGVSAGLAIARRMEIPAEILERARSLIDPVHHQASEYLKRLEAAVTEQESLRAALEEERRATAEKYAALERRFEEREASRRTEFEAKLNEVVAGLKEESDRLLRGLEDQAAATRLRKTAAARAGKLRRSAGRLREEPSTAAASPLSPGTPPEIAEHDRVRIRSLDKIGIVDSIQDDTYTVLIGPLRFRTNRDDLLREVPDQEPRRQPTPPAGGSLGANIDQEAPEEINVIGMRADEATDRVDKFLDQAFLAGVDSIRIIHGHGKGILRRAVADLLRGHAQVETFHAAAPDKGGTGATIAFMRKE